MKTAIRKNAKQRTGTVLVEAALILPFLVFLAFALIEYGWIFLKTQDINNAARHGARLAALPGARVTDATNAIDNLMSDAGIAGYELSIDGGQTPAQPVTVTIMVPYRDAEISLTHLPLLPVPEHLRSSVSMAKERG